MSLVQNIFNLKLKRIVAILGLSIFFFSCSIRKEKFPTDIPNVEIKILNLDELKNISVNLGCNMVKIHLKSTGEFKRKSKYIIFLKDGYTANYNVTLGPIEIEEGQLLDTVVVYFSKEFVADQKIFLADVQMVAQVRSAPLRPAGFDIGSQDFEGGHFNAKGFAFGGFNRGQAGDLLRSPIFALLAQYVAGVFTLINHSLKPAGLVAGRLDGPSVDTADSDPNIQVVQGALEDEALRAGGRARTASRGDSSSHRNPSFLGLKAAMRGRVRRWRGTNGKILGERLGND